MAYDQLLGEILGQHELHVAAGLALLHEGRQAEQPAAKWRQGEAGYGMSWVQQEQRGMKGEKSLLSPIEIVHAMGCI